jgi:glucose-6-phosphate 1-dehydrogenase
MTTIADHHVDPHLLVVLGATSDLMRRKLLPAIYRLRTGGAVSAPLIILGASRQAGLTDEGFRDLITEALATGGVELNAATLWCSKCLHFQSLGAGTPEDFQALAARVRTLEREHQLPGNRVFYLALPPTAYMASINGLGQAGLHQTPGWIRVVVEKPFGRDLASAIALNEQIHQYFDESEIYRIDHYLGKETVQNLLIFRFANAIFEPLWHRNLVKSVQITVAEALGVGGRAGYYDQAGALRDMVQNHLTQLLTLTTMEVPVAFDAESIRTEKAKVLRAILPVRPEHVIYGQYARGAIDGQEAPGYREEPGVAPDSATETFVALKLSIENWRWQGVPFYLVTGKRLPKRFTQIAVTFRCPPVWVFDPHYPGTCSPNVMVFTVQPDEGFDLHFEVKAPGEPLQLKTQRLRYRYAEGFAPLSDAYDTLLLDIMAGDQTLFVRADEVEWAWRIYAAALDPPPSLVRPYPAGAWGPAEAAAFMEWPDPTWLYR